MAALPPAKENLLDFTDEMMEDLYQMAYHQYTTQKIPEAIELFQQLMTLNPKSYKFALGMASCKHQLKSYDDAINYYLIAMVNDQENPTPAYFALECCLDLKDWTGAKFFVDKTLELCGNKEEFTLLKNQASLLKKGIDQHAVD